MVPYCAEKSKNRAAEAFFKLSDAEKKFLLEKGYQINDDDCITAFAYSQRSPDSSRITVKNSGLVAGFMGHCNPVTKKYERDAAMRIFHVVVAKDRSITVRYYPLMEPTEKMSQSLKEETGTFIFGPPNPDGSYGVPYSDKPPEKERFFEIIDDFGRDSESDSDSDSESESESVKRPRFDDSSDESYFFKRPRH